MLNIAENKQATAPAFEHEPGKPSASERSIQGRRKLILNSGVGSRHVEQSHGGDDPSHSLRSPTPTSALAFRFGGIVPHAL
jgi:hypothetical protein